MTHCPHHRLAPTTTEPQNGLPYDGDEAYSHSRGDAALARGPDLDGPAADTHSRHTSQRLSNPAAESPPLERAELRGASTGTTSIGHEVYEDDETPSRETRIPAASPHADSYGAARSCRPLSELLTDLDHHLRVAPDSVGGSLQRLLSRHQVSMVPDHYAASYNRLAAESFHLGDTISRLERNAVRTAARGKSELDLARTKSGELARRCEDLEDSLTSAHEIMAEYFAQVSPHAQSLLDGSDGQSEWKRELDDFLARKGYRTGARTGVTDSCSVLSQEINND